MPDAVLKIIAVSRPAGATVVHTSAGRFELSPEDMAHFGLAHAARGDRNAAGNAARRDDAVSGATRSAMRAVALMLRANLSLRAACERLGVNYHSIRSAATHHPQIDDLLQAAQERVKTCT